MLLWLNWADMITFLCFVRHSNTVIPNHVHAFLKYPKHCSFLDVSLNQTQLIPLISTFIGTPSPEIGVSNESWKMCSVGGCYNPLHLCSCVSCFDYVSVCGDWQILKERDWWIVKWMTLKGWRYQNMGSSFWCEELLIPPPSTNHQRHLVAIVCSFMNTFCLLFNLFVLHIL